MRLNHSTTQMLVRCSIYARIYRVPTRIGGKGTVRRKVVRKPKASTAQDDKKLQGALKKLNVQPVTGVEEVNMFREDGNVLHFTAPKGEFIYSSAWYSLQILLRSFVDLFDYLFIFIAPFDNSICIRERTGMY